MLNQDILISRFLKKLFYFYFNTTEIGLIFVNLKVLRTFNNLNLYLYIHDSFLDLLLLNLKKDTSFLKIRKDLVKRLSKKYLTASTKLKNKGVLLNRVKKRIVLKISRKILLIFLKNKILKKHWSFFKELLNLHLRRVTLSFHNNKIFILGLSKKNINAAIVSEFFFIRLRQYYTI